MKHALIKRNICIGFIDGITIPLVLAAVLTKAVAESSTIVIACLAIALTGGITMTAGGYLEGKKYEPVHFPWQSALTIGASYVAGGVLIALPFILWPDKNEAFIISVISGSVGLLVCGYIESSLHGASGVRGALRVCITGLVAAFTMYMITGWILK